MLQEVKWLILKFNTLNQTIYFNPFLTCSTIFCRLIIWCTFPSTEREKQTHQKSHPLCFVK